MASYSEPVIFNNSTGSNSNSGCGPSNPITLMIQYGTGTTHDIYSYSGGSLSDIQVGHVAYYSSGSSGVYFNRISGVNASSSPPTISFDRSWNVSGSMVVGGKRSTLDNTHSRKLLSDDSWITSSQLQIEATTTDYTLSSPLDIWGFSEIYGHDPASGGAKPRIVCNFNNGAWFESPTTSSGNLIAQALGSTAISNLRIAAGVDRSVYYYSGNSSTGVHPSLIGHANQSINGRSYSDMVFNEDAGSGYSSDIALMPNGTTHASMVFTRCVIYARKTAGLTPANASSVSAGNLNDDSVSSLAYTFIACRFIGDPSTAIGVGSSVGNGSGLYVGCSWENFTYSAVIPTGSVVQGSALVGNAAAFGATDPASVILGNILVNNTTAFANVTEGTVSGNAFYGNGSTATTAADNGDITLADDPFTDSANSDFSLTDEAQASFAGPDPAYGDAVTGGVPPLNVAPIRSFDLSEGGGGGTGLLGMNGGING